MTNQYSTDTTKIKNAMDTQYQKKLVSGTNIKTINNNSILGSGNITVGGGSSVTKTSDLTNDGSDGTHPFLDTDDVANDLTTSSAGKVLDARQGKALADLIGDAITYINM